MSKETCLTTPVTWQSCHHFGADAGRRCPSFLPCHTGPVFRPREDKRCFIHSPTPTSGRPQLSPAHPHVQPEQPVAFSMSKPQEEFGDPLPYSQSYLPPSKVRLRLVANTSYIFLTWLVRGKGTLIPKTWSQTCWCDSPFLLPIFFFF